MIATQNNRAAKEQSSVADNEEKGETRDIVAKIINWGSGAKSSGKDYSKGTEPCVLSSLSPLGSSLNSYFCFCACA